MYIWLHDFLLYFYFELLLLKRPLCSTLFCCAVLCWSELCFAFLCYAVRCCVEFNLFRGNNEDHRPQSRPLVVHIYMCIICWYCKQCACSLASNLINIHLNRTGWFCCFNVVLLIYLLLGWQLTTLQIVYVGFLQNKSPKESLRQKILYDFFFHF